MTPAAAQLTSLLALGTVAMQVASVLLLALVLGNRKLPRLSRRHILLFTFVLTLAASVLTLVYSEVFGFVPCFWCWVQRAFLYPLPVLIGIGMARRWEGVWKAVASLSVGGALAALYQHYLQVGGTSLVPCPAVPGAADCAKRIIFEFGYITFPLMAFTIFVFIFLLMLVYRKS
jgi:disulfide bond formation protein DsbB